MGDKLHSTHSLVENDDDEGVRDEEEGPAEKEGLWVRSSHRLKAPHNLQIHSQTKLQKLRQQYWNTDKSLILAIYALTLLFISKLIDFLDAGRQPRTSHPVFNQSAIATTKSSQFVYHLVTLIDLPTIRDN